MNQRKHNRREKLEEDIEVVIFSEGERIVGKLIDISFKGIAVKVDTELNLDQKEINIKFAAQKGDEEFLKGKVVGHDKDTLRLFIDNLAKDEMYKMLTVFYPQAGQQQLSMMAQELINQGLYSSDKVG